MPLKLILMRHMKSNWDTPGDDHARTLNPRGTADAPRIGAWLATQGHLPGTVCVSSAQRTRETWDGVASTLGMAPEVHIVDGLYLAEADHILAIIRAASAPCLAIIAHNPGIAEAAAMMATDHWNDPNFDRYPTGATTVFELDAPAWSDVSWGQGRIVDFVVPRAV